METLSNQEIFDRAVKQLSGMKGRAGELVGTRFYCKYRSPSGPCLAGAFIPDDMYSADWENTSVADLPLEMIPGVDRKSINLLARLQEAHDTDYHWSEDGFSAWHEIEDIADYYGLTFQRPAAA